MASAPPESRPFILVHLSDLHFHRLPRRPRHYLSKRGLGALNLALNRRRRFPRSLAQRLVRQVQDLQWDHLVITGDLTQLGLPEEFRIAREILAPLLERGPAHVTVLPGNHDRYVREHVPAAFEDSFGQFFPARDGLATIRLGHSWWLAAWDSTEPVPLFRADGLVRQETLQATERWLALLPPGARVVLANHYPLEFPKPTRYRRNHELRNLQQVRDWVHRHPVELYLHGHLHHNWIQPLAGGPEGQLPVLTINSAASTQRPGRNHQSAFHRLLLPEEGHPRIEPMRLE